MKNKGLNGWIEIFRGGTQIDSQGNHWDGDGLIDKAVEKFDVNYHEPPLVKGHPVHDDPAFGWVSAVKAEVVDGAKHLLAKFREVVPEFAQMVADGRYKKRSASFYPDGRLRHVGFLGAMPPAVKGLADVAFAEDDGSMTFDFGDTSPWTWGAVMDVFRKLREWFIENHGQETANAIIPEWRIEDLAEEKKRAENSPGEKGELEMDFKDMMEFVKFWDKRGAVVPVTPEAGAGGEKSFSEADLEAAKKEAAADAEKKAKDAATAEFAETERKRLKAAGDQEIADFVDKSVKDGTLPPAWKDAGIKNFMQSLDHTESVEFAEAGEKKTGLGWFKDFLEGLPKLIDFSELATRDKDVAGGDAGGKLDKLVKEKMVDNRDMTYSAAFAEVQTEHPDLTAEYQQEIEG